MTNQTEYYNKRARDNMGLWRLIFEGGMSKKEVDHLSNDEFNEAICALNEYNRMVNKLYKDKQKK